MQRARLLMLVGLLTLCVAGCGVPNEEHQRISDELSAANKKMAELNAQIKTLSEKEAQAAAKCDFEKARATSSELILEETKRKLDASIADLQKKLRLSDHARATAEDALKTANEGLARLKPLTDELAKTKDEAKSLKAKLAELLKEKDEVAATLKKVEAELKGRKEWAAKLPGDVGKYQHVQPVQDKKKADDKTADKPIDKPAAKTADKPADK